MLVQMFTFPQIVHTMYCKQNKNTKCPVYLVSIFITEQQYTWYFRCHIQNYSNSVQHFIKESCLNNTVGVESVPPRKCVSFTNINRVIKSGGNYHCC